MKGIKLKYITPFSIAFYVAVSIFYSCKKTDSTKGIVLPSSNMQASVGEQNLTFNTFADISSWNNHQYLNIVGQTIGSPSVYQVEFNIVNPSSNYIGSYKLGYYSNNTYNPYATYASYQIGAYYPDGPVIFQTSYFSDSVNMGVITITSYNSTYQTISGTFNFKGHQFYTPNRNYPDSVNINGSFFVTLKNEIQ